MGIELSKQHLSVANFDPEQYWGLFFVIYVLNSSF